MALSVFADKARPPTDADLEPVLGPAHALWLALQHALAQALGPLAPSWGFAGKAYGWSLRLRRGERVVVYLAPGDGQFLASLALGEKACERARQAGLAPEVLAAIEAAPRYAEGRGLRWPVRTDADVAQVVALAVCKMAS